MRRFSKSRIVVFSTGNVYPFTSPESGGPTEDHATGPVGEYAWTCLARERIVSHLSERMGIPVSILRINYAVDLRYGVLTDIALKVFRREPVDLRNGYVNAIWQSDACAAALLALERCSSPPFVLNVTGQEILSVRKTALAFGREFETPVEFTGSEAEDALLSDARRFHSLWKFPKTDVSAMICRIAHWLKIGGELWNKPTHFEERKGIY
jgi:nucleoside-diphosphate-sugar epimerase